MSRPKESSPTWEKTCKGLLTCILMCYKMAGVDFRHLSTIYLLLLYIPWSFSLCSTSTFLGHTHSLSQRPTHHSLLSSTIPNRFLEGRAPLPTPARCGASSLVVSQPSLHVHGLQFIPTFQRPETLIGKFSVDAWWSWYLFYLPRRWWLYGQQDSTTTQKFWLESSKLKDAQVGRKPTHSSSSWEALRFTQKGDLFEF